MLDQLIEFDRSLLLYLNNLGTPSWDGFWLVVTNKLTFIPLYLVLIYLIAKRFTIKEIVILVLTIAGMILFTDQITNLFKFTFERLRPCAQEGGVRTHQTRGVLGLWVFLRTFVQFNGDSYFYRLDATSRL